MTKKSKIKGIFVGSSGKIGRFISQASEERPDPNLDLTFQYRSVDECASASSIYLNPWEKDAAAEVISIGLNFDVMFLFAGVTSDSSILEKNSEITRKWLDVASLLGCGRVIVASSSAVYGLGTGVSFTETSIPDPANDYGKSKLKMESDLATYREAGMRICNLRIGNVLGADSLWKSMQGASSQHPLELDRFENGAGPVRSYIDPFALLSVLVTLAKVPVDVLPHTLNVAVPNFIHMESILNCSNTPWVWKTAKSEDGQKIVLDCSLLEGMVDFSRMDSDVPTMLKRVWSLERNI